MSNYGNDHDFETCPGEYILQDGDRMRRTNPESASSLDWFKLPEYDIGKKAKQFNQSGFAVERQKPSAKSGKTAPPWEAYALEEVEKHAKALREKCHEITTRCKLPYVTDYTVKMALKELYNKP